MKKNKETKLFEEEPTSVLLDTIWHLDRQGDTSEYLRKAKVELMDRYPFNILKSGGRVEQY